MNPVFLKLVSLLSVSLCAASLAAATTQESFNSSTEVLNASRFLTTDIDEFIQGILSSWNSPAGVSVAVVQQSSDGSWNVETKGYGIAKADGTKMSEDSLVCIASNSKLFNVLATGLLISNESLSPRITWDTKIASLVPEWQLMDPFASKETTIVDAMSHRTGLPRHDLMYGRTDNTSTILQRLRHLRPSTEFRTTWQYNNNMYLLLSYLPKLLVDTHPPFARYVKDNIFVPLGLMSTTYSVDVARASGNLAEGFARDALNKSEDLFGRGTPRVMVYPNSFLDGGEDGNYKAGAGGVIMNAKDAAIWMQTLLLEGRNPRTGEQVIPAQVIDKVASGITVPNGRSTYPELSPIVYGGGQSRGTYRGHEFIEHGGSTTGFKTQITRFPSAKLGVSVFSNDDMYGGHLHEIIKWRIVDKAFGLDPVDWDARLKAATRTAYETYISQALSRPTNPSPPSSTFGNLAGTYRNPGYDDIELCLFLPATATFDANETSGCVDVAAELGEKLPGAVDPSVPTFIAKWDRAWSTHLRLEHFEGNLFNLTALESRPTVNNATQHFWTAFAEGNEEVITVKFANDGNEVGFGITGGFWGAGAGVGDPVGESVKERAEVWFWKM